MTVDCKTSEEGKGGDFVYGGEEKVGGKEGTDEPLRRSQFGVRLILEKTKWNPFTRPFTPSHVSTQNSLRFHADKRPPSTILKDTEGDRGRLRLPQKTRLPTLTLESHLNPRPFFSYYLGW